MSDNIIICYNGVILLLSGSCIDFSMLSILIVEELDVLLGAGLQDQVITCKYSNE